MYDATLSTIPLKEIATTQPIYKGEDDEGRLDFRTNLCILDANYARYHFVGAPLVALGLTEICRKIGKGRVYWLAKPEVTGYTQRPKGTAGVYIFRQLPDLIYEPFQWGAEDGRNWDNTKHNNRHQMLNARAGGLKGAQCVMPIALGYDPIEKVNFHALAVSGRDSYQGQATVRINSYHTEEVGCKAVLCIVPKAYLGWCTQLREGAVFECGRTGEQRWWKANLEVLHRYQAPTGQDVVERLWDMYYAGEPRALSEFRDILAAVHDFHVQWAPTFYLANGQTAD